MDDILSKELPEDAIRSTAFGKVRPLIDRNRCEGKADCVVACPYGVFAIGLLPDPERSTLSLRGKIKGFFHGWKQAFTPKADACRGCGKCISACPEKAISLIRPIL